MDALCLNSLKCLVEFVFTHVNPRLWLGSYKLSNSPKLSLLFASGYINTGGHFLFPKYHTCSPLTVVPTGV